MQLTGDEMRAGLKASFAADPLMWERELSIAQFVSTYRYMRPSGYRQNMEVSRDMAKTYFRMLMSPYARLDVGVYSDGKKPDMYLTIASLHLWITRVDDGSFSVSAKRLPESTEAYTAAEAAWNEIYSVVA